MLRGNTRYKRDKGLSCVTDDGDWDDLSLELGLRGSGVFETEGDLGCLSGEIFWDDLSSGRMTDFARIWSGGS